MKNDFPDSLSMKNDFVDLSILLSKCFSKIDSVPLLDRDRLALSLLVIRMQAVIGNIISNL